jgi:ribosomal protein S20
MINYQRTTFNELKECRTALQTIIQSKMVEHVEQFAQDLDEIEQLVAIIGKSISTAQKNGMVKKDQSIRKQSPPGKSL